MMDTAVPPLFSRAEAHGARTAVLDGSGHHTYNELLEASNRVASALLAGREDLREARIAFLLTPGFPWVAVQWGIQRAGGIAVPLPLGSPAAELAYILNDTGAEAVIGDEAAQPVLASIDGSTRIRMFPYREMLSHGTSMLPAIQEDR